MHVFCVALIVATVITGMSPVRAAGKDPTVSLAVVVAASIYASRHCPSLIVEKDKISTLIKQQGINSSADLPGSFNKTIVFAVDAFDRGGPDESCNTISRNFRDVGTEGFILVR